jgi:hypothetical protein
METHFLENLKDYMVELFLNDPRIVAVIEGISGNNFVRREEFNQVADELKEVRTEMNFRFEQADARIQWLEKKVDDGFEEMNKRFEEVDKRFEEVNKRFEEVDKRFDAVDKRFDRTDKRIDGLEQEMRAGFEKLEKEMRAGFHNVQVHIDRLGSRWGIRNESVFRQTMKELLEKSFGMTVAERFIGGEQFDCIISNGKHILIEITASAGATIRERLLRKRQLYIDETGIVPDRFLLAVGSIHSRRAEALRAEGFEVIEPEDN